MHIEWLSNPEDTRTPGFLVGYETIDYIIGGYDGILYPRAIQFGRPHIVIRWVSGGGFFNNAPYGNKVHEALSILSEDEWTKKSRRKAEDILSGVPPISTIMYDEHGRGGNSVSFSNRAEDGGIGVRFYSPYYDDRDWQRRENNPEFIQEANLLIKPQGSGLEGIRTGSESVVFATVAQMHAIMRLTQALEKAGAIGNNRAS